VLEHEVTVPLLSPETGQVWVGSVGNANPCQAND